MTFHLGKKTKRKQATNNKKKKEILATRWFLSTNPALAPNWWANEHDPSARVSITTCRSSRLKLLAGPGPRDVPSNWINLTRWSDPTPSRKWYFEFQLKIDDAKMMLSNKPVNNISFSGERNGTTRWALNYPKELWAPGRWRGRLIVSSLGTINCTGLSHNSGSRVARRCMYKGIIALSRVHRGENFTGTWFTRGQLGGTILS